MSKPTRKNLRHTLGATPVFFSFAETLMPSQEAQLASQSAALGVIYSYLSDEVEEALSLEARDYDRPDPKLLWEELARTYSNTTSTRPDNPPRFSTSTIYIIVMPSNKENGSQGGRPHETWWAGFIRLEHDIKAFDLSQYQKNAWCKKCITSKLSSDVLYTTWQPTGPDQPISEIPDDNQDEQEYIADRHRQQAMSVVLGAFAGDEEPQNIRQARNREDWESWKLTINAELKMPSDKNVYTECRLPDDRKPIRSRLVFKVKRDQDSLSTARTYHDPFCGRQATLLNHLRRHHASTVTNSTGATSDNESTTAIASTTETAAKPDVQTVLRLKMLSPKYSDLIFLFNKVHHRSGVEILEMLYPSSGGFGSAKTHFSFRGQEITLKMYPRLVHRLKSINSRIEVTDAKTKHAQLERILDNLEEHPPGAIGGWRIEVSLQARTLEEAMGILLDFNNHVLEPETTINASFNQSSDDDSDYSYESSLHSASETSSSGSSSPRSSLSSPTPPPEPPIFPLRQCPDTSRYVLPPVPPIAEEKIENKRLEVLLVTKGDYMVQNRLMSNAFNAGGFLNGASIRQLIPMKDKSVAFDYLREFIIRLERQAKVSVKYIRTDNGEPPIFPLRQCPDTSRYVLPPVPPIAEEVSRCAIFDLKTWMNPVYKKIKNKRLEVLLVTKGDYMAQNRRMSIAFNAGGFLNGASTSVPEESVLQAMWERWVTLGLNLNPYDSTRRERMRRVVTAIIPGEPAWWQEASYTPQQRAILTVSDHLGSLYGSGRGLSELFDLIRSVIGRLSCPNDRGDGSHRAVNLQKYGIQNGIFRVKCGMGRACKVSLKAGELRSLFTTMVLERTIPHALVKLDDDTFNMVHRLYQGDEDVVVPSARHSYTLPQGSNIFAPGNPHYGYLHNRNASAAVDNFENMTPIPSLPPSLLGVKRRPPSSAELLPGCELPDRKKLAGTIHERNMAMIKDTISSTLEMGEEGWEKRGTYSDLMRLISSTLPVAPRFRPRKSLKLSHPTAPDSAQTVANERKGRQSYCGVQTYAKLLLDYQTILRDTRDPLTDSEIKHQFLHGFQGDDAPVGNKVRRYLERFIDEADCPFPSLQSRREWYRIPLFISPQARPDKRNGSGNKGKERQRDDHRATGNEVRLTYPALNASVRKALNASGIYSKA
ncbi:hypothetical protein B9479_001734 [Cryptococcus floricola]|uniref:Uncharacterized protein n=1 Tax=Cryptococcus floricola TaxID=2591691 RepID=A0A5D3B3P7_9TREE|nr:hypothetical protein B9479_001734 [Cryptococcus floricola]